MRNEFHPDMSIEKMASWLDGNLSAEEMTQLAEQIQGDPMLLEMVAVSDEIDSDMEAFEASGEQLPEELQDDDFDIPNPGRDADRPFERVYGMVCKTASARYAEYECCDAAPAACAPNEDDSDEESGLLDKLKGLFSGKDKE